jgi:hypothetical protein
MYKNALQTSILSFLLSSSVFIHPLLTSKHIRLDAVTSILAFSISHISCAVPTDYFFIILNTPPYILIMYFQSFAILSLAAFSVAAPTPNKRAVVARQSGPVLADTTYNDISIAGGQAGNAQAEAAAVFSALDLQNPENIDPADLTFLNEVNQVANDAEKEAFNPAVEAATGDEADQIQVCDFMGL